MSATEILFDGGRVGSDVFRRRGWTRVLTEFAENSFRLSCRIARDSHNQGEGAVRTSNDEEKERGAECERQMN